MFIFYSIKATIALNENWVLVTMVILLDAIKQSYKANVVYAYNFILITTYNLYNTE